MNNQLNVITFFYVSYPCTLLYNITLKHLIIIIADIWDVTIHIKILFDKLKYQIFHYELSMYVLNYTALH